MLIFSPIKPGIAPLAFSQKLSLPNALIKSTMPTPITARNLKVLTTMLSSKLASNTVSSEAHPHQSHTTQSVLKTMLIAYPACPFH